MKPSDQWPSRGELESHLARILGVEEHARLAIVDRRPNVYTSSAPCEIVTCRLAGDRLVQLLCKNTSRRIYAADSRPLGGWYEADVYRSVLAASPLPVPRFHGAWEDGSGEVWLALEYLEDTCRLSHAIDQSSAILVSATWLGSFHAANEARLSEPALAFLRRYDLRHYQQQIERIRANTRDLAAGYPWLPGLLDRFGTVMELLLGAPHTVIHGEYYPKNLLVQAGKVVPIDWETAAIGPGEIDLACLTEGWDDSVIEACRRAYLQARQGTRADEGYERTLAAARAFVSARWLGFLSDRDRARQGTSWIEDWRLGRLLQAGQQLGLA